MTRPLRDGCATVKTRLIFSAFFALAGAASAALTVKTPAPARTAVPAAVPGIPASLEKVVLGAPQAAPSRLATLFDGTLAAAQSEPAPPPAASAAPAPAPLLDQPAKSCAPESKCPFHRLWRRSPPPKDEGPRLQTERLPLLRFVSWLPALLRNPLGVMLRIHDGKGDKPVELRLPLGRRVIFTADPEITAQVLRGGDESKPETGFRKNELQLFPLSLLMAGRGDAFLAAAHTWKRSRERLDALFAPARVHTRRTYAGMLGPIDARVARLRAQAEAAPSKKGELELSTELPSLTLEVLLAVMFRTKLAPEELAELSAAYRVAVAAFPVEAGDPLRRGLKNWPAFLPSHRKVKAAHAVLDRYAAKILDEHAPRPSGEPEDMIDSLASARDDAGRPLSRAEKINHVRSLMLVGHETTASLLGWALHAIAANPAKQAALREELDRELGARAPAPGDMRKLPYLDWALSESLRLYPPLYLLMREAKGEQRIPTSRGTLIVPDKAQLVMTLFLAHRREEQWGLRASGYPAGEFHPERFDRKRLKEEGRDKDVDLKTYAWGQGERICVGVNFAQAEAKLVIARLLQNFELLPGAQAARLSSDLSLKMSGGTTLLLRPRR